MKRSAPDGAPSGGKKLARLEGSEAGPSGGGGKTLGKAFPAQKGFKGKKEKGPSLEDRERIEFDEEFTTLEAAYMG